MFTSTVNQTLCWWVPSLKTCTAHGLGKCGMIRVNLKNSSIFVISWLFGKCAIHCISDCCWSNFKQKRILCCAKVPCSSYLPPKSDIQYLTKATQQMNTAAPTFLRRRTEYSSLATTCTWSPSCRWPGGGLFGCRWLRCSRMRSYWQRVHRLKVVLRWLPSWQGAFTGTRRSSSSVKSSTHWADQTAQEASARVADASNQQWQQWCLLCLGG